MESAHTETRNDLEQAGTTWNKLEQAKMSWNEMDLAKADIRKGYGSYF